MTKALILAFALALCQASEKPPVLFVDVKGIETVDPLKHGFQIILYDSFVHHYLNEARLPTIYMTTLALNSVSSAHNKMLYREQLDAKNTIILDGLEERTWYYVCLEFENIIKRHAGGNTSTDCRLARTLDKFGGPGSGFSTRADILQRENGVVSVDLEVDIDFPSKLTLFFEHGDVPLQTYLVSDQRSLRATFTGLTSGFNYGQLCVLEEPLSVRYTMMGRTIHVSNKKCYFDNVKVANTREVLRLPNSQARVSRKSPPPTQRGPRNSAIDRYRRSISALLISSIALVVTL